MTNNTLETLSISVSGGVFSLLLYENVKNDHGQDGFILGKVETTESKKLTDADHWVQQKQTVIRIRSIIPTPHQFHFYDSSGTINEEKIRNFLGHNETDVVGWYVYRPNRSNLRLLLREKIIHRQLAKFFHIPEPHFTSCILIADCSDNKSTHSLSQTFVRYNNGSYDGIPLHIMNLSDPICTYKNGEHSSEVVNNIIRNIKPSNYLHGHILAKNVHEILQQKVKDLVAKVAMKEQLLFKLENELRLMYGLRKCVRTNIGSDIMENGLPEDISKSRKLPNKELNILTSEL